MESGRVAVHLESRDPGNEPLGLLDVSGREAVTPKTGANAISAFSPGVYFVRPASGMMRGASSVVAKVTIAR